MNGKLFAALVVAAVTCVLGSGCGPDPTSNNDDFDPPTDAGVDAPTDPGPEPECVTQNDCFVPPCMIPECTDGVCGAHMVANGTQCKPTVLDVFGECIDGACVTPNCRQCADMPCNIAYCQTGACAHAPAPDNTECFMDDGSPGACISGECHGLQ